MDNIIYEEETVKEVVYEGDLILDSRMSEKAQRQHIFRMMRKAGLTVENEDEYTIGYEGAEDLDGISETQTSHFVVTRTYQKKVPYKVTYETVYEGDWALDSLSISPEEQKQRIFEQMHQEGITPEDEDELQIGYEGVEDLDGISETQTSHFVVFRVHKEKVSETVEKILLNEEMDSTDKMRMVRDELVALREKVRGATNADEISELSSKISEVSDLLDALVNESSRDYAPFEETLAELEAEIKKIQDGIADNMKEYLESYERIQGILKEQTEAFDSTMTNEQLSAKVDSLVQGKMAEDQEAITIRDLIDTQIRQLKDLVKKRNKVRKDFEMAKSLGISALEYKELTDNFRSRNLVHAILEKKGLGELLAIPSKERTPEQKRQIRQIRKEIFDELAEAKKNHEDQSILDLVEALYGIEMKVQLKGKQRILVVKPQALENIKKNSTKFPEKIINTTDRMESKDPLEAPKDMVEAIEKRKELNREEVCSGTLIVGEEDVYDVILRDHGIDIRGDDSYTIGYEGVEDNEGLSETQTTKYVVYREKEDSKEEVQEEVQEEQTSIIERITIFHGNDGKTYVRNPVFERFNIEPIGEEVTIEGTACHEIHPGDVIYIERNQNNEMSPYTIEYRDAEVFREVKPEEEERRDTLERITIFEGNDGKLYARNPVFERFDVEPIGEEVRIENTACHEISPVDVIGIAKNANNDYSPYTIDYRSGEVTRPPKEEVQEEKDDMDTNERITIFEGDDGRVYVRKPVLDRFDIDPVGEEVRIENTACYEIHPADAIFIDRNAENDYSPYQVQHRRAETIEMPPVEEKEEKEEERTDTIERITVFQDKDGKMYVRKPVFERFDIDPIGEEVRIEGTACAEVDPYDVVEISRNAHNSYSPYDIQYRDCEVERVQAPVEEEPKQPVVSDNADHPLERITLFHGNDGKTYVRKPVFERFDMDPANQEEVRIEGTACQEASPEDIAYIEQNANNSYSPYVVEHREAEVPVNVEEAMPSEEISDESDEYIEGTNIKKPRARLPHESDDEYVEFLRDYYARKFRKEEPNEEKQEEPVQTPVVEEPVQTTTSDKPLEKFTIFRDVDHPDRMYARGPVFERFDIEPLSVDGVRIDGTACYPIPQAAVDYMIQNANNSTSPYVVEYRDIRLEMEEEKKPEQETMENRPGLVDRLVIFRDVNNPNKYYIRKPAFERFDATPIGEEVRLEGVAGYEVSPVEVARIVQNQNNDYSPYQIEYRDVALGNTNEPVPPTQGEDEPTPPPAPPTNGEDEPSKGEDEPDKGDGKGPGKEEEEEEQPEIITLYRDLNDNNQVYAPEEVLERFGIEPHEEPTMIEGVPSYKISRDTDQIIHSIAKMSREPRMEVRYVDVHVKEIVPAKPKPHVEEILDRVTTGLDIRAKDQKRYAASNIQVARGFRDELHSGNYAYNIVHVVPASLKAGLSFFRKLSGKIMTSPRAKASMEEIEKRLGELSDEELEVLFEEYKGSQLKTDMNNQINPLILERLKKFGLQKVAELNEKIRKDYALLFTLVGQIRALEKKMARSEKSEGSYEAHRQKLLDQAAVHVQSIVTNRRIANNILSSGVHGLEEDFKAVSTKLSYVGMRFAKTKDFNNELQHQLGDYGKKLNQAIADEDSEAIVENFMGLESCYFKNTDIQGSILGRRSVGSKYYSPLAEQFDYRDDPFIRDLFTTIAVTSAAISAINAVRVHQIEAKRLSDNHNEANAYNEQVAESVRSTGRQITDKSDRFREGMEAQAHEDVLADATTTERASLDLTGWKFNDAYHAADRAGHDAYNQFNLDVTSRINTVTSDYAQGLISQSEALSRMAQISSDAQATLVEVVESAYPILQKYAASHPQFNLSAIEQSMQYILANPGAIMDMNQAVVETMALAEGLQNVSFMPLAALGELPSDMASTIVCAASAALLAANVSSTMSKAGKKGVYGNEVTDMMEEYLAQQEGREENHQATR